MKLSPGFERFVTSWHDIMQTRRQKPRWHRACFPGLSITYTFPMAQTLPGGNTQGNCGCLPLPWSSKPGRGAVQHRRPRGNTRRHWPHAHRENPEELCGDCISRLASARTHTRMHGLILGCPGGSVVKNPPAHGGDVGSIPGWGRSPGEGESNPLPHSSVLAWEISWAEEPSGLQSVGSQESDMTQDDKCAYTMSTTDTKFTNNKDVLLLPHQTHTNTHNVRNPDVHETHIHNTYNVHKFTAQTHKETDHQSVYTRGIMF